MRKQKISEPTDKWTVLVSANGREILKHSCSRCSSVTLIPDDVEPKHAFHCGHWVEAPKESWLTRLDREKAPEYHLPIFPLRYPDHTARK